MATQLSKFYDEARALSGAQGVVKLAILTKMSSQAAATAPDSAENLQLFTDAIQKLKQQLGK